MIEFKKITLYKMNLKLQEPFEISSARITHRPILLCECEDKEGVVVWSECVAKGIPNYSPEIIDTAWIIIKKHLAPLLIDKPFKTPQAISLELNKWVKGNLMAKAALEMAAWAVAATKKNQSLAQYIGGIKSTIPSGLSIGLQPSNEVLVNKVKEAISEGYQKIKLKIKPGLDVELLEVLQQSCGKIPLMVDANNAYSLDDIEHLKTFDRYNLIMIEQPLAWDDILSHRHLQKECQTPICLDESIHTLSDVKLMVEFKAGQIVNIKPGRVGGFTESIAMHDYCSQHHLPVWCGGMLESGIGRAYNVALASLPNFKIPGDISPSKRYWAEDVVTPEWTMNKNGEIAVPLDKVGLGVEIKKEFIQEHSIETTVIES